VDIEIIQVQKLFIVVENSSGYKTWDFGSKYEFFEFHKFRVLMNEN